MTIQLDTATIVCVTGGIVFVVVCSNKLTNNLCKIIKAAGKAISRWKTPPR